MGKIILHELFHIYSRYHAPQRQALYQLIDFSPIAKLELGPAVLGRLRLTNPDAADVNYKITVRDGQERPMEVVLVTYARGKATGGGDSLKQQLTYGLFEVKVQDRRYVLGSQSDGSPRLPAQGGEGLL